VIFSVAVLAGEIRRNAGAEPRNAGVERRHAVLTPLHAGLGRLDFGQGIEAQGSRIGQSSGFSQLSLGRESG
jgi:hypothetical protein